MSTASVVGRAEVLAELAGVAADVERERRGRAVVVVGPPGIGKSTIAGALGESLPSWTVLVGRCAPAPAMPRRALTEVAVAALGAGADLAAVDETVFGAAVRALLGMSVSLTESARQDLMTGEGLLRLITSASGPALVVVEDLHWADDETLAVLDYVVDHLASSPVLLLTTTRDRESPAADAMRDEWNRRRVAQPVALAPLTGPAVAELVGRLVAPDAPTAFVESVNAASEGNPLLVEEFARHALDSGALRRTGATWHYDGGRRLGLPPSYQASVTRRIDALAERERDVLQLAALCGRQVDPARLVRVGIDADAAADAIAAGLQAQLLRQRTDAGAPVEFRHALTCEAVAWTVTEATRRRIAANALDTLRGRGELDDRGLEVASRLADAAGDRREACLLLIEAARRSVAAGATATALVRLDAADAVADADLLHQPEIRELRVRALAQAGRSAEALRIGQELLATLSPEGERPRRDRVVLAMARAAGAAGDWCDAGRRLDEAFGEHGAATTEVPTEVPTEALSLRALAAIELGDVERAGELATQALARVEDGAVRCEALEVLGRVARETDYLRAAEHFRAGVEAATAAGLGLWRARALLELGLCEATVFARADVFEEAQRRAVECGALSLAAMVGYNLANLRSFVYDERAVDAAEASATTARHLGAIKLEAMSRVVLAQSHAVFGRRAPSLVAADEARRTAPDDPEIEGLAAAVEGFVALTVGEVDVAAERYAVGMELLAGLPTPTATGAWYYGPVVLAAAGHDITERLRAQLATPGFAAVPFLAMCGRMIDAISSGRAGDAVAAEQQRAAAAAIVDARPEYAERLAGPRHVIAAAVAPAALADGWGRPLHDLELATEWFRGRGIEPVARWCSVLLRDAGVGPRRRGRSQVELPEHLAAYGITKREFDVLNLLGRRLTNREIADELTVSPATVKSHVERLLTKTGRRNRVELGELARVGTAE